MAQYQVLRDALLQILRRSAGLISDANVRPGMSNGALSEWENRCDEIQKQLLDDIVRVAVVGAIKSGKSTFVNSFFKGDHLMRGAGVITSIVTRIRNGSALKATLYFKSWDEVNSEMALAMVLFPHLNGRFENAPFDIRRKQDRSALQKALDDLTTDQWFTDETKNSNSVLLMSYLRGYETIMDIIGSDTVTLQYEKNQFREHRTFVGNDILAVYLRDVELEINSGDIDSHIEIADCQGSDSSNPLHLISIQDYLLRTHLIVYVISSRTGLRQADIKFLSMIKKMGIMENILFVINFDFSEHAAFDDLNQLVDRIREDLSLIKPSPQVYTLSALFHLFNSQKENLTQRDRQRLSQWEREKKLVALSDRDTEAFASAFNDRVTEGRSSLLLKNNLERLNVIVSGFGDWVRINHEIFSRDVESAGEIIERIKLHQIRVDGIKSMIKSTLDGSVQKIKQDLKADTDRFFDVSYGEIMGDIIEVIRGFRITPSHYRQSLQRAGFSNTLFLVFQEFKGTLDRFMADTINPAVIRFVRTAETRILEYFESIAVPYDAMASDAIAEYAAAMGRFGIPLNPHPHESIELPDIDTIKIIAGLSLPPASAVMHYSARIKTEAGLRLGFYSLAKIFKRMLRKPVQDQKEQEFFALKDGVLRMKRETERSIISHFKDYKENIKFQYLFKMVDAVSNSLNKVLNDRFQSCDTDLSKLSEQINERQDDKQQVSDTLKTMMRSTDEIHGQIQRLREKIND